MYLKTSHTAGPDSPRSRYEVFFFPFFAGEFVQSCLFVNYREKFHGSQDLTRSFDIRVTQKHGYGILNRLKWKIFVRAFEEFVWSR